MDGWWLHLFPPECRRCLSVCLSVCLAPSYRICCPAGWHKTRDDALLGCVALQEPPNPAKSHPSRHFSPDACFNPRPPSWQVQIQPNVCSQQQQQQQHQSCRRRSSRRGRQRGTQSTVVLPRLPNRKNSGWISSSTGYKGSTVCRSVWTLSCST